MSSANKIIEQIQREEIQFLDFRFTDLQGKTHHITSTATTDVVEKIFKQGLLFDSSPTPFWQAPNLGEMLLKPDPETAKIDPFSSHRTMIFTCSLENPETQKTCNRDPRHIAKKAESWFKTSGIADEIHIGLEPEFFLFDSVKYRIDQHHAGYEIDTPESHEYKNTRKTNEDWGHRLSVKEGYCALAPLDLTQDIRSEIFSVLTETGVAVKKHSHKSGASQHKLTLQFNKFLRMADDFQICKYVIHQVARTYGKTASFMPKPVVGENGSGMTVHISLWKEKIPLFSSENNANPSENARYFIGGILKHAKTLNAFTNPLTNSYKRLIPESEVSVVCPGFSSNPSKAYAIPFGLSGRGKRIRIGFPDSGANAYLGLSALLMAGMDGIVKKIDPWRGAIEKKSSTLSRSLQEALLCLDMNRDFLKEGDVFDNDFIESFIKIKTAEVMRYETVTHPVEFEMYYSI